MHACMQTAAHTYLHYITLHCNDDIHTNIERERERQRKKDRNKQTNTHTHTHKQTNKHTHTHTFMGSEHRQEQGKNNKKGEELSKRKFMRCNTVSIKKQSSTFRAPQGL